MDSRIPAIILVTLGLVAFASASGKPYPSYWGPWSEWSECSKTCGGGSQSRTRVCKSYKPYGKCHGDDKETRDCNTQCCPVDGNWGGWGSWSNWSDWSHEGHVPTRTRTRTRDCDSPAPSCGGKTCEGPGSESQKQRCRIYGKKWHGKCSTYY